MLLEKPKYKILLKLLDPSTTNIVKDIFVIATEDIHKKQQLDTKTKSNFEKKLEY